MRDLRYRRCRRQSRYLRQRGRMHLVRPGDVIIIATYNLVDGARPVSVEPKVVFVDAENRILRVGQEIAGPRRRGVTPSAIVVAKLTR